MAGLLENNVPQPWATSRPVTPQQAPKARGLDIAELLKGPPDEMFVRMLEEEEMAKQDQQTALQEAIAKRQEAMSNSLDLTPISALIDSSFGTKISPIAEAANKERLQGKSDLADLESKLVGQGGPGINGRILSYMNSKQRAGDTDNKEERIASQFQQSQINSAFKDIKSEIGKERDNLTKTVISLNRFDDALTSRVPERINSMLSVLAKDLNREAGALSIDDVNRQFLKSYDMQFREFLSKFNKDQKYTEADIDSMSKGIAEARNIMANVAKNKISGLRSSYEGNPTFYQANLQHSVKGGLYDSMDSLVKDLETSKRLTEKEIKAKGNTETSSKAAAWRDRLKATTNKVKAE